MTGENTTMSNWSTFAADVPLLDHLRDLNYFGFHAELPMSVIWANDEVRYRVGQLVYDEVLEILRVSGLYRYDQLSMLASAQEILIRYSDDRFGFEVGLEDETIRITRSGSAFDRFHRWYIEVAPHFGGLIEKVSGAIEQAIRSVTGLERRMPVQNAAYRFRFIVYDIISSTGEAMLNAAVLQDLIPRCPGVNGSLSDDRAGD